jgi:hypothetical protein
MNPSTACLKIEIASTLLESSDTTPISRSGKDFIGHLRFPIQEFSLQRRNARVMHTGLRSRDSFHVSSSYGALFLFLANTLLPFGYWPLFLI